LARTVNFNVAKERCRGKNSQRRLIREEVKRKKIDTDFQGGKSKAGNVAEKHTCFGTPYSRQGKCEPDTRSNIEAQGRFKSEGRLKPYRCLPKLCRGRTSKGRTRRSLTGG